ncbi:MAG: hypothetical protein AB7O59_24445 [Pirellulales bacterium]
MHTLTIFPLGNADCCRIDLACGKKILFDYANTRDPDDKYDLRCDLEQELRDDLQDADRDYYDVVAFTHLDEDHYKRATEFFWFAHSRKYQGEGRIKIAELWVPAAAITEEDCDKEEACAIQDEARYRLKQGAGVRVFSRPDRLREWCRKNGVDFEKRKHLFTDAGQIVPGFTKDIDGVEFFVHSPFAKRLNDAEVEDRNQDAIVMHATFVVDQVETKVLLMADSTHDVISDIVDITKARNRTERLETDVIKLPHHCSYLSLGPEKGKHKTVPDPSVRELFEDYTQDGVTIVSTSKPIPASGSAEDEDPNPPHRQAANYYKEDVVDSADDFIVTMEHPTKMAPKPVVIQIDTSKATIRKRAAIIGAAAIGGPAPRAG